MNTRYYAAVSLLLAALLVPALFPRPSSAGEQVTVAAIPDTIRIGARYNGMKLQVKGTAPAKSAVIVRFTGAPSDLHLREKGKVFSLLWMNVGTVIVKNIPKVCIIDTSEPLDKIGSAAAPYSLAGLLSNIEVERDGGGQEIDVDKELLLLKMEEGLYSEAVQGVILGPEKNGTVEFTGQLFIPSALAPGTYKVEAVAIRDGKVVAETAETVTAEMVGFPQWLSLLAFQKSLLYGVMATVIAVVSGLVIGLVFQSRGAH